MGLIVFVLLDERFLVYTGCILLVLVRQGLFEAMCLLKQKYAACFYFFLNWFLSNFP